MANTDASEESTSEHSDTDLPNSSKRPAPRAKAFSFNEPCVTVKVGEGERAADFFVHRGVLSQSTFFNNALSGDFEESETGVIHLVDDDSEVFAIYVNWLYRGMIIYDSNYEYDVSDDAEDALGRMLLKENRSDEWELLIEAYIFGDKILHREFQNKVIDEIARLHGVPMAGELERFNRFNINLVWEKIEGMPKDSPLKRLVLDEDVYFGGREWLWEPPLEACSQKHLADLVLALMKRVEQGDPREGPPHAAYNLWRYHVEEKATKGVK